MYLLNTYSLPGDSLGLGHSLINKTDSVPDFIGKICDREIIIGN